MFFSLYLFLVLYWVFCLSILGYKVIDAPCCPVASNNTLIFCTINQTPCPNRDEYFYWDALHLSDATNMVIANRSYNAQSPTDTYPIDISDLVKL